MTLAAGGDPPAFSEIPGDVVAHEQKSSLVHDQSSEALIEQEAKGLEPGLNVRLLKERMELEIGLLREGSRLLVFLCLLKCFAIAFFLSSQPTHRAETRFYATKHLQIADLEEAVTTAEVFDAIMRVSSNVREMVPSSSNYITDPLSQILIGSARNFPSGPIQLPATRNPQLVMEYTMTVRHGIEKTTGWLGAKKRLIVRSYQSGDTAGSSCWAWYSLDYNHFVLEYGRNNLDDRYIIADFVFNSSRIADHFAFEFLALRVNITHATMTLQDSDDITNPLFPGTVPASCENAVLEVGDAGLVLGNLQYFPTYLSTLELQEIEQSGQSLERMASGMALMKAESVIAESTAESHRKTQRMVSEAGSANLGISKLSAYLSQSWMQRNEQGSDDNAEQQAQVIFDTANATVGTAAPENPETGMPSWDLAPYTFSEVLGIPKLVSQEDLDLTQTRLGNAMLTLAEAKEWSFTLSWWAKAAGHQTGAELRIIDTGSEPPKDRLKLQMYIEDVGDGTEVQGWEIRFNNAPYCMSNSDEPCINSPSVFCQAPAAGGYDGIWRHFALTYTHAIDGTDFSVMEIFIDGRSLCGIEFSADPDLIPHNLSREAAEFQMMAPKAILGTAFELELGHVRVYPRSLERTEVKLLSQQRDMKECLDLELYSDDNAWVSEFGQTCADFSALSSATGLSHAPAACRSKEAKERCPISCLQELNPVCFDGTPPIPRQTTNPYANDPRVIIASLHLENLEWDQWWGPAEPLLAKTFEKLIQSVTWKGVEGSGEWFRSFNDIRKVDYGSFIPSIASLKQYDRDTHIITQGFWLDLEAMGNTTTFYDYCPGSSIDDEIYELRVQDENVAELPPSLIRETCLAELQGWGIINVISDGFSVGELANAAGWGFEEFRGDFPQPGESFTVYYWAKTDNSKASNALSLTGIDNSNNICFAIRSTTAWMQVHNMVEHYLNHHANKGNATARSLEGQRMSISAPEKVKDEIKPDTWTYFALSIDTEQRFVRFAVNDYVAEKPLPDGEWGCNSLQTLINTGAGMDLSPIRLARFPLTKGSLQRVYLSTRLPFVTYLSGEETSRLDRMKLTDLTIKPFSKKMIALAPPVLLQRRAADPSDHEAVVCKGDVMQKFNHRLEAIMNKTCQAPFNCPNLESQKITCLHKDSVPPETFFGEPQVDGTYSIGGKAFAEFAWSLQNDVIIRDGKQLQPAADYIDSNTQEVKLIMPFYTPSSRIATVIIGSFDLSAVKTKASLQFLQLTIMEAEHYQSLLIWTCVALALAITGFAIALPAAIQEVKENLPFLLKFFRRHSDRHQVVPVDKQGRKNETRRLIYSSNTSQPDVFDVLLNLALIFLMVIYLVIQTYHWMKAGKAFADIADIDWSSDKTFDEKMRDFMHALETSLGMVMAEEWILNVAFWMLIFCCVRLVIFMRMHPKIAAVSETFTSVVGELINFAFSFGVIFVFIAYLAQIRFGYLYDEFSTFRQALITQFALLIGDSSPDYSKDPLMCVYVVGFVFLCTLSLLNFLLAIVMNGYTLVTERALENKVARGFLIDLLSIPLDLYLWNRHRLPTRIAILRGMQESYPAVFAEREEVLISMSRERFAQILERCSPARRGLPINKDSAAAAILFDHYMRHNVLQLQHANEGYCSG